MATQTPTIDSQVHAYERDRPERPWRGFLTGPAAEIQRVCDMFGVRAYANEGLLDHSLHTVLIDRKRKLAANPYKIFNIERS